MMIFGFLPLLLFFILGSYALRGIAGRSGGWTRSMSGGCCGGDHENDHAVDSVNPNRPAIEAPSRSLEATLFAAADRRGGRLTISDVVIETGMSVKEAEKLMEKMTDGTHVSMEVGERGGLVYLFPELHRRGDSA